jgi:diguanylate cyclase (GGDEF)-like protein
VQPLNSNDPSWTENERRARNAIHSGGLTQPHGCLLAVSESDCIVRQVSANVEITIGISPTHLVDRSLERVLGASQYEMFRAAMAAGDPLEYCRAEVRIGRPIRSFECIAHRQGGMLLIEMLPIAVPQTLNVTIALQGPLSRFACEDSILGIANRAAAEIRRASGFERVMIYQFDGDWNAQVIAEAGPTPPVYLGLYFPAGYFSARARRSCQITTLRTIVDVDAQPVALVPPTNSQTGLALDLSRSILRSSAPEHLLNLRNMGVRAMMTLSLIVRGKPWGMIVAHHGLPHRLDFTTHTVCNLLAQLTAAHILSRTSASALEERLRSRERIETYMAAIERSALPPPGDGSDQVRLLSLFRAEGLVSCIDGREFSCGLQLEQLDLEAVTRALKQQCSRGIAGCDSLASLDLGTDHEREVSGALYFGFSEASDDYILLLRREHVEPIVWAPTPAETPAGPSSSVKRGRSLPWTQVEIENARLLREQFMQLVQLQRRKKAEAQLSRYADRLRTLHTLATSRTQSDNSRVDRALTFALEELALEQAYFGAVDELTNELVMQNVVTAGAQPSYGPGKRYPLNTTLIGRVVDSDSVLAAPDVATARKQHGIVYHDEWQCYVAVAIRVDGRRYGAIGFLGRSVRHQEFSAFDTEFVRITGDIIASAIERSLTRARLDRLAFHDSLTGLPNRALFMDRLAQCIISAKREDVRFALLFLDLDGFKTVNDSLGHLAGDEVLKSTAARLESFARQGDTVARLGGDEFVILAPLIQTAHDAGAFARRVADAVRQPMPVKGQRLTLSTSIGVSLFPESGTDPASLLACADAAMFEAKAQGKNRVQLGRNGGAARK